MKHDKIFTYLVLLITLIKVIPNNAGMSQVWSSIKSATTKAANKAINNFRSSSPAQDYNDLQKQYIANSETKNALTYSFNPRELANQLTSVTLSAAIGYILPTSTAFKAWDSTQYVSHKLIHQLDPLLIPKFNEKNLFKKASTSVRTGKDLPLEEQMTIEKRLIYTKPALAKFLEIDLANTTHQPNLRIGFCGSGGGYRAMLSTVGFLVGAQKIGLLDTVLYMSALSGSTWALGPWTSLNNSIYEFKKQLISKTQNMVSFAGKELLPPPSGDQLSTLIFNLELKYLFHQPITSVDLWGAMIANKLFEPLADRQNIYLSDQGKIISDGKHIFPIYTAVNPQENLKYNWFEFTPFEIGSYDLQAFTPAWAFGQKFFNGKNVSSPTINQDQYGPPQSLGYYLGIFGSAFTVNLEEILDMMRKDENASNQDIDEMELKITVIEEITKHLAGIKDLRKSRISPAKLFNYTYNLPSSPLQEHKQITLVDAGLAFNLPTPPLLRPERALDIIFIFDSSADIGSAGELKKAESYARQNNLPFPQIDYQQAKTQTISVFTDPSNPKIPTIIYMPLIKDLNLPSISKDDRFVNFDPKACVEKDYCSTFNFKYEQEEFETLTRLTEINIVDNVEVIKKAFRDVLQAKNQLVT